MDVLNGLTFEEARKRVTKSFRESVQNSPALSDDKITFDVFNLDGFSYVSSIPTIAVILAYGLALILVKFQHADLLVVVCIVTIVMLLNFIVVALYRQSEKKELAKSLHDILSAYESSCENMLSLSAAHETGSPLLTEPLIPPQLVLGVDDFKNKTYLSSGHSQVSIVHTYRDGQWMRLPVLLLAEGDIIALMGGDLTPGRCYEIERINAPPTGATATNTTEDGQFDTENENLFNKNNNTSWSVGRLMNAGEKVHIRNRQQFSQQKPAQHQQHSPTADSSNAEEPEEAVVQQPLHFGERHRSLAAESVEILGLCGDVRCFQLAETPIVAFLQSTTDPAHVSYNNCPISGVEGGGSGGHGSGNYSVVHTNNSNDKIQTPSLIRTIFYTIVVQEGFKVFILMFIVTTLATIVRAVLVNESSLGDNSYHNLSYDDWVVSMLIPTATACIFFLPLALPLTLIMAEAMATADVLASAEVTLRPVPIHNKNTSTKEPNTYDPVVNTDTNPLLTSNTVSKNNNSNKRKGSHDVDMAHGSGGSDNDDPEMEDEFMDEDIDERAEDIAEGISTQVRWSRYLGYLARVLWHRLLLGMHSPCQLTPCRCCASSNACSCAHNSNNNTTNNTSSDHEAYLPIPLARSRLLEVLGAVTMVCFVDDDVICEGYSVTEEIFLLMDNPQLGDNAHPSHKHKQSSADVHKTRSTDEAENNNTNNMLDNSSIKPTVAVKGIVLDLHANPEATGSRFENPQWWRYLPSLKPLGLNAMLTYAYTATSGTHDVMQRQASGGDSGHGISSVLSGLYGGGAGGNSGGSGNSNGSGGNGGSGGNNNSGGNGSTRHRSNTNTSHLPYPSAIQRSALHNTSTHTTHTIQERRSYSNTSEGEQAAHHEHHHTTHPTHPTHTHHTHHNTHTNHNTHTHPHTHSQAYQQTERSLVRHIRHLLPLESLRELAEEIGFEQSDLSAFTRVLEVNVLAPGLENAHLLEDTHQWGQEESRRRGSLLPQLRGGVYKDFRDGSLQMMSLGDPSLVLNYCREYWDGSTRSITPLSSTDRAEVLSVYERWRLEDFEVVAFCYSPIPTAGLQPLLSKEDAFSQANVANFTRHTSASVSGANGNNGVGTVNSNGKSQVLNTATSFTAHRHPSVASPFVPAKHNTLFFVDPITTQDLHRIAQGITSKSRANGVKANTRMNAHHHTHHSHNSNTNNTNTNNNTSDVVEHEPTNTLTDSHTEQNNTTHNTNTNTDNREESLYDFYPETADAAPLSHTTHTTQHTPNTQYTQNSNLSYVTANTGPVSPSYTTDNTNTLHTSTSGVAIPRAASFTVLSPTSLTTLSTNTNSTTSINSSTNTTLTEEQRRAGQATPVKNPLYGSQDVDKTPPRAQDDIGINNQSPPQPRVKSGSVESPPRKIESSVKQSSVVGNNGSGVTCSGGTTTGARKTSRSDASYMVTNTSHTSHAAHHKHGQAITKSVSLDRVSEYHTHGTEHEESNTDFKHTDDDASEESLLLPLPLPGILKASTSDRDVRVKQHGGDKVVVIQTNTDARSKKQPHSPVLLFPDDDDASSVTSSIITPTHSSGVSSQFIRASTVESSNPTRVSIQGIGVRFGVDSTSTTESSPELGLNIDTEHGGGDNNTSGGGLSRSHTFHVTHPASISVSEKLNSGAGIAHIGSGVSSGGSLTPPLVPRNPFALTKSSTVNALTPPLRHHSSEYVQPQYRHHPHGAMYTHITSKQRQAQQVQRSHQQSRQLRRASTRQLWTQMRQQVFLGMAASSVPVRKDVPNTKEDLDSAGVRFVYFSAQNMKRSKPVAEKIGIPFDWNCAISLRELEGDTAQDPHRHISNYADWDVLAHMPHGIEAIKAHIQNVDNVPLLVSLFTDATPLSVRQMVEVFRDNGEVVLTIGGGYRSRNHAIYASSDVACSVSVLPGLGSTSTLPASEKELIEQFPVNSECSLCRADVLLSFRLIGLTTINLLQTPFREDLLQCSGSTSSGSKGCGCKCKSRHNNTSTDEHERPYVIDMPNNTTCSPSRSAGILRHNGTGVGGVGEGDSEGRAEHLRLSVLLEVIRKGRILLRNMHQALALFCVATLALSAWPIVSMLVPLSLPPSPPPALALLFQLIYVPALCLTLLQCGEPEGVMKNTPRKNQLLRRPRDVARFCWYLGLRSGYVLFSIALTGWLATASTMQSGEASFGESMWTFYYLRSSSDADLRALWLVQDLMSAQALLSIVSQALTLLVRGQTELAHFPWPWRLPEAYFYVSSLAVLVLHGCVLGIREEYRRLHFSAGFMHSYAHLDWFVWVAMFVLPVLGVLQGVWVNTDDQYHYKRYLQFLRLEFDTRLGMHSPR